MPTRLRHIAVHVEEPKPGRFAWVLSERLGAGWQAIDTSSAPVARYRQAMADGLLALQALVEDLDAGPRAEQAPSRAEAEEADEADEADEAEDADAQPAEPKGTAPAKKGWFGFGPAR